VKELSLAKVLVAGCSGHLGKYVALEFKNRGHWVRALPRNLEKLAAIIDG